jgi:hypothetical protein
MWTHKIGHLATGVLLASSLCATLGHAQAASTARQTPSLGDAARQAREQNKGRQPGRVFTNDDMADLKGTVSVVGTVPPAPAPAEAAPAEGAAAPAAGTPTGPAPEVKDEAYWRAQFAAARKKLADDSKELDVLQREYNLKEQQFYSDPNVALREQYGRADLNKTRDEINVKKADVEKDQQAITTLEDQLRQAGGNPGWGRAQ